MRVHLSPECAFRNVAQVLQNSELLQHSDFNLSYYVSHSQLCMQLDSKATPTYETIFEMHCCKFLSLIRGNAVSVLLLLKLS